MARNCRYSHDGAKGSLPPLTDKEKEDIAKKRAAMPCGMFSRGQCKFGAQCQYSHASKSMAGACIEGDHDDEHHDLDDDNYLFMDLEENQYATLECCSDSDPSEEPDKQMIAINQPTNVKKWIADTGSENHLISRADVSDDHPGIHQTDRKMNLATANGVISANERVHTEVGALGMPINPIMLTNTVNVVSVGRMVVDGGWSFHWTNDGSAYFENADGEKFFCDIQGYVPVIDDTGMNFKAMPGVGPSSGVEDEVEQESAGHEDDDLGEDAGDHDDRHDGDGEPEMSRDEKLKQEANTPEHCLTHRRKNPFCWVCAMVKMTAKPARRVEPSARSSDPTAFAVPACWCRPRDGI